MVAEESLIGEDFKEHALIDAKGNGEVSDDYSFEDNS